MANARTNNVLRVDTSAQFDYPLDVVAIKYIGNTSGTASIKADSTSGEIVWVESGTANVHNQLCLKLAKSFYVTVTNSAVVYIYYK